MNKTKIGIFLSALRHEHGYTLDQIAQLCNVTKEDVTYWEQGGFLPGIEEFDKLSKLYGISIDNLIKSRNTNLTRKNKAFNITILISSVLMFFAYLIPYTDFVPFENEVLSLTSLLIGMIALVVYSSFIVVGYMKDNELSKYVIGLSSLAIVIVANIVITDNFGFYQYKYIISVLGLVNIIMCIYKVIRGAKVEEYDYNIAKIRRVFVTAVLLPYFYLFIAVIIQFIKYNEWFEDLTFMSFTILIGLYIVTYIFLDNKFYSSRKKTIIYLAIPPSLYFITFGTAVFIVRSIPMESFYSMVVVTFVMSLPLLLINMDLIVRYLKNKLVKT